MGTYCSGASHNLTTRKIPLQAIGKTALSSAWAAGVLVSRKLIRLLAEKVNDGVCPNKVWNNESSGENNDSDT